MSIGLSIPGVYIIQSVKMCFSARPLGVQKPDVGSDQIALQFESNPPIEPITIINLIQINRNYKLPGRTNWHSSVIRQRRATRW